jgi:hypothetical protein
LIIRVEDEEILRVIEASTNGWNRYKRFFEIKS